MPALCQDLDLVVDLQRCASEEPARMDALCERHRPTLELWLFGIALGCAGFGLHDEALGMLDAVQGIDAGGGGRAALLADIIQWQNEQPRPAGQTQGRCTCTAA